MLNIFLRGYIIYYSNLILNICSLLLGDFNEEFSHINALTIIPICRQTFEFCQSHIAVKVAIFFLNFLGYFGAINYESSKLNSIPDWVFSLQ